MVNDDDGSEDSPAPSVKLHQIAKLANNARNYEDHVLLCTKFYELIQKKFPRTTWDLNKWNLKMYSPQAWQRHAMKDLKVKPEECWTAESSPLFTKEAILKTPTVSS